MASGIVLDDSLQCGLCLDVLVEPTTVSCCGRTFCRCSMGKSYRVPIHKDNHCLCGEAFQAAKVGNGEG